MPPRRLPWLNFFLATSSLGVQLFLLVPWHDKLDQSFEMLKMETQRKLAEQVDMHERYLTRIDKHMKELVALAGVKDEQIDAAPGGRKL